VEPIFLTKEEIQTIADKAIKNERLSGERRIRFLLFHRVAYVDVKKVKRTAIAVGVDDQLWIFTDKLKTKIKSRIPLLPVSLAIIKKYEDDPACINANKVLPVLSNQKYNPYLKEIAEFQAPVTNGLLIRPERLGQGSIKPGCNDKTLGKFHHLNFLTLRYEHTRTV
jgi:hypothetical protein